MSAPRLSVIMVDGGFRERFHALDYFARQSLPAEDYEIIWVEYTDRLAPAVAGRQGVRTFCLGRTDEPQVLGYAYNKGIAEARGEVLVIADADVACEAALLERVLAEHERCEDLVLYVLRLDQPPECAREPWDLDYLRATCSVKHTFNYGGCTTVRRRWMLEMNGCEQLPFFAGYHYLGGDNYIRFKNRGLKVMWHPSLRVYHPGHEAPPAEKFDTVPQQEALIMRRAVSWDWMAYDGIDPARNRPYDPEAPVPSQWRSIRTENGALRTEGAGGRAETSAFRRGAAFFARHGLAGGLRCALGKIMGGAGR
jgi:glycosyltransferase involved in cell wall biosynthesis